MCFCIVLVLTDKYIRKAKVWKIQDKSPNYLFWRTSFDKISEEKFKKHVVKKVKFKILEKNAKGSDNCPKKLPIRKDKTIPGSLKGTFRTI